MKSTFGKGLESLIPKKATNLSERVGQKKESIFFIEIEKIKTNPLQPRKEFDQKSLNNLAESIQNYGILQPLIVSRQEEDGRTEYRLIVGERRLISAKIAGLREVPVIIRKLDKKEELEISIVENVQRMDLNPIEKAEAFQRLHKEFGLLQKDIANICGMSREAVANSTRLLELSDETKQAIKEKKISEGHAKAILGLKDLEKQKAVLARVLKNDLNVRETESLVQKINVWRPFSKKTSIESKEEINEMENSFKDLFSIKDLKIGVQAGKLKMIIFFRNKAEMKKILQDMKEKF